MTARAREAAEPPTTVAPARTPAKAMAVVRRQPNMVAKARTTARGKVAANPVTTVAPARTLAKPWVAAKFPFPKIISNGCWLRSRQISLRSRFRLIRYNAFAGRQSGGICALSWELRRAFGSFPMLLAVNPLSVNENFLSFSSEHGAQLFAIHGPARQRAASTRAGYRAFVQSESQAADESKFAGNAS